MKLPVFFLLLLLLPSVMAIDCLTDDSPFIRLSSRPVAVCSIENVTNTHCFTFLSNPVNASEEWGVMPDKSFILDVSGEGVSYEKLSFYPVINNLVTVGFSTERLFIGVPVTANIWCGSEIYTFNFTPQYIDYAEVGDYAISVKDNTDFIIIGLIVVVLFIMLFVSLKKR